MSDVILEFDKVSKKFRRGQLHDSLRDLIPSLAKSFIRGRASGDLGQQEFWALRDVSFQVQQGEAVGIIGHNGAGKSTILKILTDIMKPTMGTKTVNGSLSALIEVGAGFHPDLTGRENIYLNGTILGMSRATIRSKLDEIVEFSGLAPFIDTPVKRYSSGMYARLGFSIACHVDPDILVVDEVLSVGDWKFQNRSMEKMKGILESGATVVFVSHNLKAISDLCSRVILLEKGEVVAEGQAEDVVNHYIKRVTDGDNRDKELESKDAILEDIQLLENDKDSALFEPGDKVTVEVTVRNRSNTSRMSTAIALRDETYNLFFYTDSVRCGQAPFTLEPGETHTLRFELDLHLAPGTYFLNVALSDPDLDRLIDHRAPAKRFVVHSDDRLKGVVNLYPRLTSGLIEGASPRS